MRLKRKYSGGLYIIYFYTMYVNNIYIFRIILTMENRLLKPLMFLCSDEITDREEMNVMDQILEVNSSE